MNGKNLSKWELVLQRYFNDPRVEIINSSTHTLSPLSFHDCNCPTKKLELTPASQRMSVSLNKSGLSMCVHHRAFQWRTKPCRDTRCTSTFTAAGWQQNRGDFIPSLPADQRLFHVASSFESPSQPFLLICFLSFLFIPSPRHSSMSFGHFSS